MKTRVLLLSLLLPGFFLLVSCGKDEDKDPEYKNPTIAFDNGAGYVYQDTQWKADSSFMIGIHASADAANSVTLTRFEISSLFLDKPQVHLDSTFNSPTFDLIRTFQAIAEEGQQFWTYKATDSRGQVTEKTITLTTIK